MRANKIVGDEDLAAQLAAAMVRRSMWFELEPQCSTAYLFTFKNEHQAWVEQWLTRETSNPRTAGDKHEH